MRGWSPMVNSSASSPDAAAQNEELIARWHRTGDLNVLWPDIPVADRHAAQADIRRVAEAVMRGSVRAPTLVGDEPARVRALGVAGFTSGMGALLGWWLQAGTVDAADAVRKLLLGHLEHGVRRRKTLDAALLDIVRKMRQRGVDPIVLKGTHTGAVHFPALGTRPAADIDLLIRPEQRALAAIALQKAGFDETRSSDYAARSEWRPSGQVPVVHSVEMDHADNPWAIDLHTSLDRWYFRGLRRGFGDEAFEHTAQVSVAGSLVRGLAEPHLSAFLALHASHDLVKMQLVRLIELTLVIRAQKPEFDWDRFAALIARTRTVRFTYPALALVEVLAPGTVSPKVLELGERSATARTRRVIAAVTAQDMGVLTFRTLDNKLMWARGPREWLLNVSELVLPSDDGASITLPRQYWRGLRTFVQGQRRRSSSR